MWKLTVLVLAAGCGTTVSTLPIDPAPHSMHAVPSAQVTVFAADREPVAPYVEVALLYAERSTTLDRDRDGLVSELRGRAAELGCDAIVLDGAAAAWTPTSDGGACTSTSVWVSRPGLVRVCGDTTAPVSEPRKLTAGLYATCIAYR